jgi:small subunit ribosomal protein S13
MIYLLETELPKNKPVFFGLTNIYGIGRFQALVICKKLGFSANLKISDLSNDQVNDLLKLVEKSDLILSNDLKKLQILFLKNLINIKAYKGLRRISGLPIRGQRTHTNARTVRRFRK